jgi:hypothetical protein
MILRLRSRQDAAVLGVIPLFLHNIRMPVQDDIPSQAVGWAIGKITLIAYFVRGVHMVPTPVLVGSVAASICSWEDLLIALSAAKLWLGLGT